MTRYRSTHASHHYGELRHQPMSWKNPTWLERNGELIVAAFGLVITIGAIAAVIGALLAGVLS